MLRGGRPKDTIWQHFTRVEIAGKALARCNYCAHQQSIKACSMQSSIVATVQHLQMR